MYLVCGSKLADNDVGRKMADSDPWCALYALLSNPERYEADFENVTLEDGAATYEMLRWSHLTRRKLYMPIRRVYRALVNDPYWAYRWLRHSEDPSLANAIRRTVESEARSDPAAAYLLLAICPEKAEESHWRVACARANTLYYASHLPQFRDASSLLPEQLQVSAKWACHLLLRTRLPTRLQQACHEALVKQPEWVAEYVARRNQISLDELESLTIDCRSVCRPSQLLNRYSEFLRRFKDAKAEKIPA